MIINCFFTLLCSILLLIQDKSVTFKLNSVNSNSIMARIEDFFIASNTVDYMPDDNYKTISSLIHSVKAFARITYQSVYLIDYYKQDFLYVSDNPLFLCGHTAQEVKEMGYQFYLQHVPEDEQKMLIELNSSGFKFFESRDDVNKYKCFMSYDFHLQQDSKKILINHKLTPVLLTNEGRIWIALCIVSLSAHKESGHVEFHMDGLYDYWDYSFEVHKWKLHKGVVIKEEEREVLRLSAEGLTMTEIAEKMCRSVDTIKFYKRNLFEKLQVSNVMEAISRATNYKLL